MMFCNVHFFDEFAVGMLVIETHGWAVVATPLAARISASFHKDTTSKDICARWRRSMVDGREGSVLDTMGGWKCSNRWAKTEAGCRLQKRSRQAKYEIPARCRHSQSKMASEF
eukprot:scaffold17002_cov79-Skeletonema_marinoi.AAC.1